MLRLSFVYASVYVSRILWDQSFGIRCWDPYGHVHGWVRWMQVPPWPLYHVIREDPCILRLGRSAMLHDPRISKFWDEICSILLLDWAKNAKNQLVWKARVCVFGLTLDSFLTLTWAVKALEKGDDTAAKNWFWCSLSGKKPRDYTSWNIEWSEESLFLTYIGVSKGML